MCVCPSSFLPFYVLGFMLVQLPFLFISTALTYHCDPSRPFSKLHPVVYIFFHSFLLLFLNLTACRPLYNNQLHHNFRFSPTLRLFSRASLSSVTTPPANSPLPPSASSAPAGLQVYGYRFPKYFGPKRTIQDRY